MRILLLLSTLILTATSWASEHHHLDLEMTSQEYRKFMPQNQTLTFDKKLTPVEEALRTGEKLFHWIDLINANRPDDQKIRLTSKDTRKGIPITKPNRYGPVKIEKDHAQLKIDLPEPLRVVLYSKKAPSADPLVEDKVFIEYGRRVDRLYQTAARWKMLSPYKFIYKGRRSNDVRGYYFLNTNGWDADRLNAEWADLKGEELKSVKQALIGLCINNGAKTKACEERIDRLSNGTEAASFYTRNISLAERIWDNFFKIQNARRDIRWDGAKATSATIPFVDPNTDDVRAYIKDNIEDEFRWDSWGLKIDFVTKKRAPYVVFVPGATPNVNGLGGNKITMDGNKDIGEYEVQWIIRHEFGHVLGIPDCYHEFYDEDSNEFVNYQIDTTDLMCSRAGNMNERIYEQLKNKYAK